MTNEESAVECADLLDVVVVAAECGWRMGLFLYGTYGLQGGGRDDISRARHAGFCFFFLGHACSFSFDPLLLSSLVVVSGRLPARLAMTTNRVAVALHCRHVD